MRQGDENGEAVLMIGELLGLTEGDTEGAVGLVEEDVDGEARGSACDWGHDKGTSLLIRLLEFQIVLLQCTS